MALPLNESYNSAKAFCKVKEITGQWLGKYSERLIVRTIEFNESIDLKYSISDLVSRCKYQGEHQNMIYMNYSYY